MTTQLINEATYNYLKSQAVEDRSPKQQEDLEAYESENGLNVDAEEHSPEASVEPAVAFVEVVDTNTEPNVQDAANDSPEALTASVDTVEQDANIADQMKQSLEILDAQFSITDQRYKRFLALAAKATCLVKWTGPFILDVRVKDEKFAYHVANTLGLLSFKHFLADSILNKEIKEQQVKTKYLTICSVPKFSKRDSAVDGYSEAKKGCQFVVHTEAVSYVHNDFSNIAKLENVVTLKEGATNYDDSSTAILRVRLNQQEWVETNKDKLAELVSNLNAQHKTIASKVKAETFKAWSGILLLAALWDKDVFADMVNLMKEQVGTQGLADKEKLACALSLVIPEYETLMTRFKVEKHITTKLVGNLVKGFGLGDTEISKGFTDLGLPMGQNKSGYDLETLKAKILEVVKYEDVAIQAYLTKLQNAETAKAA